MSSNYQLFYILCYFFIFLAEKPINSIDASLLKECKLKECDPEGKEAPKSMKGAVELFYGIKSGDISEH